VWIGAGVTVLGGASISDGCVIAAGSVVRGHIPPRVVAAGVPARIIRSRDATNQSVIPPATQS
jgi:acetyltransferase-like isoleucine patch superfamily enzyme